MPSWRRSSGLLLFLALASVSLAGCAPAQPGTVSGIVKTSDGKPLAKGRITFLPEAGGEPPSAQIDNNGKYSASVPAGPARVVIQPAFEMPGPEVPIEKRNDLLPRQRPGDEKKRIEVPAKYQNADTSGLHLIVQSGDNTFDVDLRP